MCKMRRKRKLSGARAAAAALATVVLGACATKSDIRDLHDELVGLAARQDSLMSQLRIETISTQDTLRTQSDQLFDFRGDIARQLQSISQALARLEALTGENQRGISSVRDQLARGTVASTTRPPTSTDSAGAAGGGRPETVPGVAGNADQNWGAAREQHNRGSYSTAQRAYEQFTREHPNDLRVPDALYFLGDILQQQDRPEDALERFLEIPSRHPTHARVPDALYRVGLLQIELGRTADARSTFQRIVNTYADHPMASLARIQLEEIG
ncbi:MAG TPA: tetratricopeptide repeat protein [Longimicrobiales bacterium]|nr:tetratricopeptide repeat protein [Longimicrobiales bacterium]